MKDIHSNPVWIQIMVIAGREAKRVAVQEAQQQRLPNLTGAMEDAVELAGRVAAMIALRTLSLTSGREQFLRLITEDTERAIQDGDVGFFGMVALDDGGAE